MADPIGPIADSYIDDIIKSSNVYNPNLNLTQGIKLRELVKLLRDRLEQEIAGLGDSDTEMQALIDTLTTNLTALSDNLTTLETNVNAADAHLQSLIDDLAAEIGNIPVVAGDGGEIQFNNASGNLGASTDFVWNDNLKQFIIKAASYGFIVDTSSVWGDGGILFKAKPDGSSPSQPIGVIGSHSLATAGGNNLDLCVSAESGYSLYLKGTNVKFEGNVELPDSLIVGTYASDNWIQMGTSPTHPLFVFNWGTGGDKQFAISSTGNSLVTQQNPDDIIFGGNQNIGFLGPVGYPYSQAGVYAQFMYNKKMLIINGGSEDGFDGDTSAILQLDSSSRGFLPSRMTTAQKNAIVSPGEGLMVYDTTLHKLCIYTGTAWETITSA